MFRRLFWMIVGASGALYARKRVIETVEKYIPSRVIRATKRAARSVANELTQASQEGKAAMKAREEELRNTTSAHVD